MPGPGGGQQVPLQCRPNMHAEGNQCVQDAQATPKNVCQGESYDCGNNLGMAFCDMGQWKCPSGQQPQTNTAMWARHAFRRKYLCSGSTTANLPPST